MLILLISRILLVALALLLISEFMPGITITGVYPAIITALILGVLNAVVRPILVILTLPISILTLGLFVFVINASLFYFAASFIEGFVVQSFLWALIGSIILSLVSAVVGKFLYKA